MNSSPNEGLRDRIRTLLASIDLQILREIDRVAPHLIVRMQPDEIAELRALVAEVGGRDLITVTVVGPAIYDAAITDGSLGPDHRVREQRAVTLRVGEGLRNR